ncbi:glycine betaine ABC transporter substrate-binding protein [Isachenkonia alkalipeptolytica]|uniref:Glycine betaine ABC transporter substrate-binding protein n=1 Tax=Isachenkonia alkalipeptolytica TaxID=2565777 RepID=A0AA43XM99_9CLOT|nr:glycine betaine ABC transporter substrate-binding protein [Isachenkonia alkalipeptolytica]NBG89297.1 glycine betaine ABC transporter substrate-binding protein [Isachenkonia alkalipeptolytica]
MKKKITIITLVAVLALSMFAFTACDEEDGAEQVQLGYVNWAEGVAMNYLAHAILEDEMGYEVESTVADVGPIFSSIAEGDYDAFVDAWLPVTHEEYMENFGDDVEDLGYNFEGARIGLVVPTYVDIDSIEEMNDVADNFDGDIIGIGPGAGIMTATGNAIDEYGLDFSLVESSGPVMAATLSEAIEDEEWVVVTGWEPHWKFAEWDLKFLEDPDGVYGAVENIHSVVRDDLRDEMPEVVEFLENFYLDSDQLGDLMGAMEEHQEDMDELEIARDWMEDNRDLIESWLP